MRKEYPHARSLAIAQAQILQAYDELNMATSRLRLAEDEEDKALDALSEEELPSASVLYTSDKFTSLNSLSVIKGKLRYLKVVAKVHFNHSDLDFLFLGAELCARWWYALCTYLSTYSVLKLKLRKTECPCCCYCRELILTLFYCSQGLVQAKQKVPLQSPNPSSVAEGANTIPTSTEQKNVCIPTGDKETCPVCQDPLTIRKMVFPCGHLTCCKCKYSPYHLHDKTVASRNRRNTSIILLPKK